MDAGWSGSLAAATDHGAAAPALLVGALAVLVAVSAVRLSRRLGVPVLLLYLAIGLVLGESGFGIDFDDAELTRELGYLALALILTEGGLATRWSRMRSALPVAASLATVGVLVTTVACAAAARVVLSLSWTDALIIGAVLAPTDAAAVFTTLRGVPLRRRVMATLEAESGLNDPVSVILVAALSASGTSPTVGSIAMAIGVQLVGGLCIGLAAGALGRAYLGHVALPASGLYPLAVLAFALGGYAGAAALGVSGFLAVYVTAVVLGNSPLPHRQASLGFAEGLAWLAQIGLFVMLGLLASPSRLPDVLLPATVIAVVLVLVARPISVAVATAPLRLTWRERGFVSWAGLRGAVPIVLATIPLTGGHAAGTRVFDLAFVVVVELTLLQAPLLPWLARRAAVDDAGPEELGVEAAPLDALGADLLQIEIGPASRLNGVEVWELRLPPAVAVSLVVRDGRALVPGDETRLRHGDQLLVVTPRTLRSEAERRIRQVSRYGSPAGWIASAHAGAAAPSALSRRRRRRRSP